MKIGKIDLGEKPLLLAPMKNITDPPFRRLCRQMGADLCYSEFISSEGLIRDAVKSKQKLKIYENERPIAIQIFGHNENVVKDSALLCMEIQPDIIDINFGCPVKKVVSKGAGAALLKNLSQMAAIAKAVVKAVNIPVTAKTRLGWDHSSINVEDVALMLQDCGIAALTIHARTRDMLYSGKADWSWIGKIKNNPHIFIPIIGNGDIDGPEKADYCFKNYGVNGIMIGRAAIGNPWIFKQIKTFFNTGKIPEAPSLKEHASICLEHLKNEVILKGEHRGMIEMRKHYASYFKGFHSAKNIRNKLIQINDIDQIYTILEHIIKKENLYL